MEDNLVNHKSPSQSEFSLRLFPRDSVLSGLFSQLFKLLEFFFCDLFLLKLLNF
jgi:hypothetical protein